MTQFLAGAVAVLAVAVAANLFLTFAVIRKLKSEGPTAGPASAPGLPATGGAIGAFAGSDSDGVPVTTADLSRGVHSLVFTMSGCESCKKLVAAMNDGERPAEGGLTVFVVPSGPDPEGLEVLAVLSPGIRAVVASITAVSQAFGVTQFPAVLDLVDGKVVRTGRRLRAELETTPAGPALVGAHR